MTALPFAPSWHRITRLGWMFFIFTLGVGWLHADVKLKAGDGKRKKDDVVIPEARDVTAAFVAGQAVDIELSGAVGTLKQAEFVVRQLPEHGTLTNLRPHQRDSNKSIITYTHAGPEASLADRFTYSVRVDGGPFSAPATVYLRGQRMEPILSVLTIPSFGKVYLGGESSGTVAVRNLGRAPYVMNMVWGEGWSGPAKLEINPGETSEFRLIFRPTKPGEVRHEIELQPGVKTSKMTLFGEGIRALTVSPSYLTLDYNRSTGLRTGVLTLVNGRPEKVKVMIKYPMRLLAPKEVEIPPQEKAEVLFQLPKTDVPQFMGQVIVESEGVSEKVDVVSRPKPAELRVVSPERGLLDFGQVNQRAAVTRDMILENSGGELLVVDVHARPPYNAEFAGQALRIEPGQQRSVKVSLKTEQVGNVLSELRISGGASESTITLKTYVREPAETVETRPVSSSPPIRTPSTSTSGSSSPAPSVAAVSRPQTTAPLASPSSTSAGHSPMSKVQSTMAAYLAMQGMPMPASQVNSHLDRVETVELVDRETSSFTVAWKKPGVAPAGWALEAASMTKDEKTQLFIKRWTRLTHWKTVDGASDKVVVKVHSLRPASQYEMRVRGVDRDGKFSEPSPIFVVTTPEPWRVPVWVWRMLVIGALLVIIYMLYKARRGDFEFA